MKLPIVLICSRGDVTPVPGAAGVRAKSRPRKSFLKAFERVVAVEEEVCGLGRSLVAQTEVVVEELAPRDREDDADGVAVWSRLRLCRAGGRDRERIRGDLGADAPAIATGGLADLIAPHSRTIARVDPFLTLEGLRLVYVRNR
jgi:hypothetical protein